MSNHPITDRPALRLPVLPVLVLVLAGFLGGPVAAVWGIHTLMWATWQAEYRRDIEDEHRHRQERVRDHRRKVDRERQAQVAEFDRERQGLETQRRQLEARLAEVRPAAEAERTQSGDQRREELRRREEEQAALEATLDQIAGRLERLREHRAMLEEQIAHQLASIADEEADLQEDLDQRLAAVASGGNNDLAGLAAIAGIIGFLGAGVGVWGLRLVPPGRARVGTVFGSYAGTLGRPGLHWINPFTRSQAIDCRLLDTELDTLKINDATGTPIEISAVVVSRVTAPAVAAFAVADHTRFVANQADAALRELASRYAYEGDGERPGLRDSRQAVADDLAAMVGERTAAAGVEIVEARLRHLAYAPEIAPAMLRRQQAQAMVEARERLVTAAVGMVDQVLRHFAAQGVVLDDERQAQMANNLMVAIISDQGAAPVVDTTIT